MYSGVPSNVPDWVRVAVEDPHDPVVLDERAGPGLGEEALDHPGPGSELAQQELDGRLAPEVAVLGEEHHPHPAPADLGQDGVGANGFADHGGSVPADTAVCVGRHDASSSHGSSGWLKRRGPRTRLLAAGMTSRWLSSALLALSLAARAG